MAQRGVLKRRGKRIAASDQWHRFFSTSSGDREFMYFFGARTKAELKPYIIHIKRQGDLYRVTKHKKGYELWDARV